MYKNERNDLAKIIAAYISGVCGAIPEQEDFELADELIKVIDSKFNKDK